MQNAIAEHRQLRQLARHVGAEGGSAMRRERMRGGKHGGHPLIGQCDRSWHSRLNVQKCAADYDLPRFGGAFLYAARSRSTRSIALSGSGCQREMPSDSILCSSAADLLMP